MMNKGNKKARKSGLFKGEKGVLSSAEVVYLSLGNYDVYSFGNGSYLSAGG